MISKKQILLITIMSALSCSSAPLPECFSGLSSLLSELRDCLPASRKEMKRLEQYDAQQKAGMARLEKLTTEQADEMQSLQVVVDAQNAEIEQQRDAIKRLDATVNKTEEKEAIGSYIAELLEALSDVKNIYFLDRASPEGTLYHRIKASNYTYTKNVRQLYDLIIAKLKKAEPNSGLLRDKFLALNSEKKSRDTVEELISKTYDMIALIKRADLVSEYKYKVLPILETLSISHFLIRNQVEDAASIVGANFIYHQIALLMILRILGENSTNGTESSTMFGNTFFTHIYEGVSWVDRHEGMCHPTGTILFEPIEIFHEYMSVGREISRISLAPITEVTEQAITNTNNPEELPVMLQLRAVFNGA